MNDAAPIHSIDQQCDMSGLLEDLKFRNIQDASKSGGKKASTSRPSTVRKTGSPRLSIRKVGTRLLDSFQRKSNRDRSSGSWDSLSAEGGLDDEFDDVTLSFQQTSDFTSVSKREDETSKKDTSAKLSWRSNSEIV